MKTPQQLSRQAIDEFKTIYQGEFGQIISEAEAQEMGQRLLSLLKILLQPNASRVVTQNNDRE